MARFPSAEWVQEYAKKLNENQAYKDAGKTWEGDIVFVVEKDEVFPKSAYIYLDLYHGECRRAQYADSLSQLPKAVYAYKGPYSNWRELINGKIDPIQGLLTGKFRLDGSLMEIMKYIRAAKEMVSTATKVQTEF
ncbi:MAG TPA: SCP2 sterol-binding domain-containing protein [Nitrososphaerales archaeon]|nr:SCP2 sterol-binding domain-containing protein [Nitrososphaerales archaeon]